MIWMDGGPSHYETFDPKPDARRKCVAPRDGFNHRARSAFLRDHSRTRQVLRQILRHPLDLPQGPQSRRRQSLYDDGSPTPVPVVAARSSPFIRRLAPWFPTTAACAMACPLHGHATNTRSGGPNFLGGQHAPFVIAGDPNAKGFQVRDVVVPTEISEGHAMSRRDLRASLDACSALTTNSSMILPWSSTSFTNRASISFPRPRRRRLRHQPGGRQGARPLWPQRCRQRMLLARRLVEVGFPG